MNENGIKKNCNEIVKTLGLHDKMSHCLEKCSVDDRNFEKFTFTDEV